jgi:hypothetical protein
VALVASKKNDRIKGTITIWLARVPSHVGGKSAVLRRGQQRRLDADARLLQRFQRTAVSNPNPNPTLTRHVGSSWWRAAVQLVADQLLYACAQPLSLHPLRPPALPDLP